jgi:hypothetical protein
MAFVQIIDYRTSKYDEMSKLDDEWEASAGADVTARRVVTGQDRDNPDHYVTLAFFDSYESAMENSNLPATQEYAQKMMALAEGPTTFTNLDIVDDRTPA